MKSAIVQDWFAVNGGAEKVVRELVDMYPDADIFSLVDFLNETDRKEILKGKKSKSSYLQNFPFARNHFRNYLPLFPHAIESLDLSAYDLIISSSYSVAKGVKKNKGQIHICYCHSPVRYAWDLRKEYLAGLSLPKRIVSSLTLAYIRKWDSGTSERVDLFIANSKNVAERIKRIYNRDSVVIYPPVDTGSFTPEENKDDYYFTTLRVVPYKRLDLIIDTFNQLPDKKLVVAGEGPALDKLKKKAGSNISFVGFVSKSELVRLMQKAKGFILAAEEDFGITSLEAQCCCTPVIAYRKGGYLETVIEGKTGVFFDHQTVESLRKAITDFENSGIKFRKQDFMANVENFTTEKFREAFKKTVDEYLAGKGK